MKYNTTPRKIRVLWNEVNSNLDTISKLKKLDPKINSKYIFDKILKYETSWVALGGSCILELLEFPEEYLPYIKITPLVKSTNAWDISSSIEDFTCSQNMVRNNYRESDSGNNYTISANLTVTTNPTNVAIYVKFIVTIHNEARDFGEIQTNTK